jgi:hypothetical protein
MKKRKKKRKRKKTSNEAAFSQQMPSSLVMEFDGCADRCLSLFNPMPLARLPMCKALLMVSG